MGNDPFKLTFIQIDAPSSALSIDVPRVLIGLEMVDCRAMRSAVCSAIVDYFLFRSSTTFKTS